MNVFSYSATRVYVCIGVYMRWAVCVSTLLCVNLRLFIFLSSESNRYKTFCSKDTGHRKRAKVKGHPHPIGHGLRISVCLYICLYNSIRSYVHRLIYPPLLHTWTRGHMCKCIFIQYDKRLCVNGLLYMDSMCMYHFMCEFKFVHIPFTRKQSNLYLSLQVWLVSPVSPPPGTHTHRNKEVKFNPTFVNNYVN